MSSGNGNHAYHGERLSMVGQNTIERLHTMNPLLELEPNEHRVTGGRLARRAVRVRDALVVSRRRIAVVVVTTVSAVTLVTAVPLTASASTEPVPVRVRRR